MLLPPLLDLLCLNIFVHFAKSLKHLFPPPLLLCSRMYLAKTWNDYPHQKPSIPSFGLSPAEHLSQHKEVSGLQFLVIPIFFAFLCFPFHCTGLWQSLKSSLTEHDLISHQFTFAVGDYPQVSPIWSLLQVCKFLICLPPASPWPPPEPPPQALLHSFLLFSFKMEIENKFFLLKHIHKTQPHKNTATNFFHLLAHSVMSIPLHSCFFFHTASSQDPLQCDFPLRISRNMLSLEFLEIAS